MLVTVEDLEKYSGVYGDPLASEYAESASEIVSGYLGYNPEEAEYSESYDGTGENFLPLKSGHITEIARVEIGGAEIPPENCYAKGNFLYLQEGMFPEGRNNVRVEYTAGWPGASMPKVIKTTALQIAALRQIESGQNIGVNSKTFGDSGTRVFLSTRKYDDFLRNISKYKVI